MEPGPAWSPPDLNRLSSLGKRRVSAVIGALVADAAAQPLHWVYDDKKREEAVSSDPGAPEFLVPSANPYYRVPCGSHSPYGDQLLVLLESLSECKGYDQQHYSHLFYSSFGPGTPYDNAGPQKYVEGTVDSTYPISGPWRNRTMTRFCKAYENHQSVKDDDWPDPDIVARIVPIVAVWAGCKELCSYVEKIVALHQPNDDCLTVAMVAARLLELFVLDQSDDPNKVDQLIEWLRSSSGGVDIDQRSFAGLLKQVVTSSHKLSVSAATKHFGVN